MQIGSISSLMPRELPGLAEVQGAARGAAAGATSGIDAIGMAGGTGKSEFAGITGGAEKSGFSNFLQRAVSEIDGKMQTAQAEQAKVLTGESSNLHQAMIAMQEASVSFSLMVEVRNKLVESYQELMRMQV